MVRPCIAMRGCGAAGGLPWLADVRHSALHSLHCCDATLCVRARVSVCALSCDWRGAAAARGCVRNAVSASAAAVVRNAAKLRLAVLPAAHV